ncbi:hypothetical protein VH1807_contig00026-0164 [Vibrio harveyi]|nr:hypothetical protein VH1807_contig00026-0164 [Vibrio harveyi]
MVVERLSIKRSVMGDGEVVRRVSSVELIWHDEFLQFIVNPTGTVTAVIFKLFTAMVEVVHTFAKVLRSSLR